jgi:hypothetical protein
MLRQIRFRNAQLLLKTGCGPVALAQQIEHLQPGCVRKGLTDASLAFKDFCFDSIASALFPDSHFALREYLSESALLRPFLAAETWGQC